VQLVNWLRPSTANVLVKPLFEREGNEAQAETCRKRPHHQSQRSAWLGRLTRGRETDALKKLMIYPTAS